MIGFRLAALPAAFVLLISANAAGAGAAGQCSRETINVAGNAVALTLCAGPRGAAKPDGSITVAATETFTTAKAAFTRTAPLSFSAGSEPSRTIDNADLAPLGIEKSLHMTIVLQGSTIKLEHALLLPGAVPLK